MKKLIYRSVNYDEDLLELNIDVHYYQEKITSSSILDPKDPAFLDFESNVLEACRIHDFELQDSYKSNNPESISQYCIYTKTSDGGARLKIFLKIRVSDHIPDDRLLEGKLTSYSERDDKYNKRAAKEYASENLNQPRGYKSRRLNIIFDDENFQSYESALRAIEAKLDEFGED